MHGIDGDLIYSYLGKYIGYMGVPQPSKLDNWETFDSCNGPECSGALGIHMDSK